MSVLSGVVPEATGGSFGLRCELACISDSLVEHTSRPNFSFIRFRKQRIVQAEMLYFRPATPLYMHL